MKPLLYQRHWFTFSRLEFEKVSDVLSRPYNYKINGWSASIRIKTTFEFLTSNRLWVKL